MLQQQAVDVPVLERGKGQAPRGAWPAPPEELLQLQWESDRIRQQATRPGVRTLGVLGCLGVQVFPVAGGAETFSAGNALKYREFKPPYFRIFNVGGRWAFFFQGSPTKRCRLYHLVFCRGNRPGSGSVTFSEWASYAEDMKVGMGVLKIIEIFHLERCRYDKFTSEFQHLQGAETLGKMWVFLKICSQKNWGAASTLKLTCQTISPVLHQGQDGMSRDSGDRGCRRIGDAWPYLRIGVGWVGSKMGRAVGWRWHFWASKF